MNCTTEWGQPNDSGSPSVAENPLALNQSCFHGSRGRALMDRVAEAGLSGAKEASGFRADAIQPRPPGNPLLTDHQGVSTARVALLVDSLQSAVFDVRVNLRGADTRVPQHFLEGSDIRTACQQMCGKTVP